MRPFLVRYIIALGVLTAIVGCDRGASDGERDTVSGMLNQEDPDTSLGGPSLSDAHLIAIFDASSAADSSMAALAATKGSAVVRDVAKRMLADHHAMRVDIASLAKRMGV